MATLKSIFSASYSAYTVVSFFFGLPGPLLRGPVRGDPSSLRYRIDWYILQNFLTGIPSMKSMFSRLDIILCPVDLFTTSSKSLPVASFPTLRNKKKSRRSLLNPKVSRLRYDSSSSVFCRNIPFWIRAIYYSSRNCFGQIFRRW